MAQDKIILRPGMTEEEYQEIKAANDAYKNLVGQERLKKQQEALDFPEFSLPLNTEFSFVKVEGTGAKGMEYAKLTTDTNHTMSLGALQRNCIYGEALENPRLQPSTSPKPAYKDLGMLQGATKINGCLRRMFLANDVAAGDEPLFLITRDVKLIVTKAEPAASYFPGKGVEKFKGAEEIEAFNELTANQKLGKMKQHTIYHLEVTLDGVPQL